MKKISQTKSVKIKLCAREDLAITLWKIIKKIKTGGFNYLSLKFEI